MNGRNNENLRDLFERFVGPAGVEKTERVNGVTVL